MCIISAVCGQVGETLDREMHHSLFGDSGLGMELASSLMAPPNSDSLMPDLATHLFGDMPAASDAQSLPEQGRLLLYFVLSTRG